MNQNISSELADLFVALSDPTRLRLLSLIGDGEVSVGYLADALEESQPKVSRHLAYLRNAGLVSTRRDGKWVYYGVETPDDSAIRHILLETLRVLGVAIESANSASAPDQEYGFDGLSDSDYRPNEIEIYLL